MNTQIHSEPELNIEGHHLPQKSIQAIIKLLERHAIAWFFVGLILLLIGDGSLRIKLTLNSTGSSIGPPSFGAKAALETLGTSLMVGVAALVLMKAFATWKRELGVLATILWALIIVLLCVNWWPVPDYTIRIFGFDVETRRFLVILPSEAIHKYRGSSMVLVVRKRDSNTDFDVDERISISPLHTIDHENVFTMPTMDIAPYVHLRDVVECQIVMFPSPPDLSHAKTIADLKELGGVLYSEYPLSCTAGLSLISPDNIGNLLLDDQRNLREAIQRLPQPK